MRAPPHQKLPQTPHSRRHWPLHPVAPQMAHVSVGFPRVAGGRGVKRRGGCRAAKSASGQLTSSGAPPPSIVMKLDVEGDEIAVLESMLVAGTLCHLSLVTWEYHAYLLKDRDGDGAAPRKKQKGKAAAAASAD